MKYMREWTIKALASGAYLSYLPARWFRGRPLTGAGLVGTLWGLAALRWLPTDVLRQTAVWLAACALAVVISDEAEVLMGQKDDPRIVIDEFAGYWTAVLFLPRSLAVVALAFVLFRVLDVLKPGWIRRATVLSGGWGVVVDDILAGIAANGLVRLVRVIYPI